MSTDIPIWNDPDVRRIYDLQDGQPFPKFHVFNEHPSQLQLIKDFVDADQRAGSDGPADAFLGACFAGIRAVESLPTDTDVGWRKFLVYMVDMNNHFLWDLYHREEVAAVAEWTVQTIEHYGWGPDGNSTPLGQRHSNAMALAAQAGGGLRSDPGSGKFTYGTGDEARRLAGVSSSGSSGTPTTVSPSPPNSEAPLIAELVTRSAAAEEGDRASQILMAALAAQLSGDDATSLKLFEEAAQLGDVRAMIEAGNSHASGGNVGAARFWFETAAAAGSIEAFGHLARLSEASGDETEEREWSRRGAEAGDGWSMGNYAYFLLMDAQNAPDTKVEGILNETLSYAVRAAHLGQVNAMYSAGLASAFLGHAEEAGNWLRRAEEAGHPNARTMMGKLGVG